MKTNTVIDHASFLREKEKSQRSTVWTWGEIAISVLLKSFIYGCIEDPATIPYKCPKCMSRTLFLKLSPYIQLPPKHQTTKYLHHLQCTATFHSSNMHTTQIIHSVITKGPEQIATVM